MILARIGARSGPLVSWVTTRAISMRTPTADTMNSSGRKGWWKSVVGSMQGASFLPAASRDESASSRPEEATEILARIGRLYRLEKEWRDLGPEDRCRLRKTRARPILEEIFSRLEELKSATVPSEPLRGAVNYALNQREALCRYLQDGRLKPDNNTAENAIRPLALGRKNWLFAGSERGARAAALFYSLVQSCKACDVNPWKYFDDMLRRIMSHPVHRLRELLPDQWEPLTTQS